MKNILYAINNKLGSAEEKINWIWIYNNMKQKTKDWK